MLVSVESLCFFISFPTGLVAPDKGPEQAPLACPHPRPPCGSAAELAKNTPAPRAP